MRMSVTGRSQDPGAPRGGGPQPARPRRPHRRVSAPMLSQVERGETSPTLPGRRAHRRRASSSASASCCASTRAAACQVVRARRRQAGARARRPPLRGAHARAARPARRAQPPRARSRAPPPAARATRRCTSPARARSPTSSAAAVALVHRRRAPRAARGRHRDVRRRPAPPLREPRTGAEATFLAVVAAGLRRS